MKEFIIDKANDGRRVDRWLCSVMPALSKGVCQKYLRLKKVRVNGKVASADTRLLSGDTVNVYLSDEFFAAPERKDRLLSSFHYHLSIVYEDENILIVDKKPGIMVHGDASEKLNTLVTHVRAYLYQKGEYDSMREGAFAPSPCNRIDRFTGGLVLFAKNATALKAMDALIRGGDVKKHYICIINGSVEPANGELRHYILKTPGRRKVEVFDRPIQGGSEARTIYETMSQNGPLSLMDCELATGRTHQIRAQFAHIGCPLLGDGQYGDYRDSEIFGRDYQALYAYRLRFEIADPAATPLGYLDGKSISVSLRTIGFLRDYFPDIMP